MSYSGLNKNMEELLKKPLQKEYRVVNMKKTVLRMMLGTSGQTFSIVTTEDDARRKLEQWKTGKLPESHIYGYDTEGDMYFALKVSEIVCMYTHDYEKVKQQQMEALRQSQAGRPSNPAY